MSRRHRTMEGLRANLAGVVAGAARRAVDDLVGRYIFGRRHRSCTRLKSETTDSSLRRLMAALRIESLEPRLLMSTVTWVNGSGGDWNTGSNWSGGSVPGAGDDAVISVSGNPAITFTSGTASVHSITSDSPLTLSGGQLTVGSTVQVNNTFTLNGGTLVGATVNAGSGGQGLSAGTSTGSTLDGVTLNANLNVTNSGAYLGVKNGLTLNGTASLGGSYLTRYPTLDFKNTQTLGGSGTVQFTGTYALMDIEGGVTLTLGSGVTVNAGNGDIGDSFGADSSHTLINQGTISANTSGTTTNVTDAYLTITNQGTAQAVGGGSLTFSPGLTSTNTGTLGVGASGSTLRIGGTWNTTGFGTLSNGGGIAYLTGTLSNTGNSTSLGGSLTLNGGTITGGTINMTGGAVLAASNSRSNVLDGVTLNGNLNVTTAGAFLGLKDGLTLNGTATVGGNPYNNYPYNSPLLDFQNTQTLGGSATVQMVAYGSIDVEGGVTATLGNTVTVQGLGATIGSAYGSSTGRTLINQGTITGTGNINSPVQILGSNLTFTNQGTVQGNSGVVWVNQGNDSTFTASNTGTFAATGSGGKITIGGTWATGTEGTLSASSSGVVDLIGTFNNAGNTISLSTTGGTYQLNGGTINGGTLTEASGISLAITSSRTNLLDGVTVNGNLNVTAAGAFLGLKDGLTLNGTATVGGNSYSNYPYNSPLLDFQNSQTLGGSATVQLVAYGSIDVEGGVTATLGNTVTVQGLGATIGSAYGSSTSRTLINQGTITGTGNVNSPVQIVGSNLTFTNQGTVQGASGVVWVNQGNDATLSVSNSGTLSATGSGGKITIGGTWASGSEGTLAASGGGVVDLIGTFNNAASTISLSTTGGTYQLNGGTINGGTLAEASGISLLITSSRSNVLDGVTVNGNLNVTTAGAFLGLKDGLTLNGTATVGGNSYSNYPYNFPLLDLQNSQTLGGSGTIQFVTNGSLDVEGGVTATLASGLTIHGGGSYIGNAYSSSTARTINNYATINSDVAGQFLSIDGGSNLTFNNYGVVKQTAAGSSVAFTSNLASLVNHGTIQASGGGNISITPGSYTRGGTIYDLDSSTINDAGTTISGAAAAIDGVDAGITWNGLPTSGGSSVSLSSTTDGVNYLAYVAPLFSTTATLVTDLTPGSSNVIRATSTANGTTYIYNSAPVTTPSTADKSGYYQVSSPVTSYNTSGYAWTLSQKWVQAGSPTAALAILFNGIAPLIKGAPSLGSDGKYHLYHETGYDTAHTFDWWSWQPFPILVNAVQNITDYTVAVKTRNAPPAAASVKENPNASGGDPAKNGQSADPVRYFDGSIVYNETDLESDGLGSPFGQIRSWTNLAQYAAGGRNGVGMVDNSLPSLTQPDGSTSVTVVNSGSDTRSFDLSGSTYTPQSFVADTLVHSGGQFVYTDTAGNQYTFYDFSASYPAAKRGGFASLTDSAGAVTYVSASNTDGTIAEVRRKDSSGTDAESWLYSYLPGTDPNAGMLSNVQLRRPDGSGGWTVVRQVSYSYYDGTGSFGNLGDLKTAAIQDPSGNTIDTDYYRYYVPGEAGGFAHALKYVFDAASYARLVTAVGTPLTASDATVAPYAQHYFQYDGLRRVVLHTVQGAGGSATGGLGTFTYQYTTSDNAAGVASWQYKTVETLPDGNQNIVYCNSLGEVMLKVYNDISDPANSALSGKQWDTFYAYDTQGRLTEEAEPSAVTGYDETKADLLNNQSGNYQYLSDSAGLIHLTDYSTSTTATSSTAGGVVGYVQDHKVQHGETGTPILLDSQQYFSHTNGSIVTYPQANQTVYRNTDGTGAETTSFAYTWYPNSSQVQMLTISKPIVSPAQNGPGTVDVSTVFYDAYGRVIWSKNADGYVGYTGYDNGTGAVIQTIADVDYSRLGTSLQQSFNLTGWAQPSGGLHLVTSTVVDGLGRSTQVTDPNGNVTYITYEDVDHAIRVYSGWNPATGTPTGPTLVIRQDLAGSFAEAVTMTAAPHLTGGVPDGTEPIGNIQSLERGYTNASNQLIEADQYVNLSGLTYSSASHLGTVNVNYYATFYGYDVDGRQSRIQDAVGTISDTLFDGLGRPSAGYIGTDDATTNGQSWSPTNAAAASNMIEVSADQYDGNGIGDGNLTQSTSFPDTNAADSRVSLMLYDWRDRLIATKTGALLSAGAPNPSGETGSGVNRPIIYIQRDNLGEETGVYTYAGDGLSLQDFANWSATPLTDASNLTSLMTTGFDDQGRPYLQRTFSVDPATGAISTNSLNTNFFYDHRGNSVEVAVPGGEVTKHQFDGAGRDVKDSTTDGGVLNGAAATWTNAITTANDVVIEQTLNTYDGDGQLIESVDRQRFDNDPTTAVGDPAGPAGGTLASRDYYTGIYYDAAGRATDQVDIGTNGGVAWVRPASVPTRSDSAVVTHMDYDAAGNVLDSVDPRGIVTRNQHDALGRMTATITAYTDGTPTSDSNQTTEFSYDGIGHLISQTAVMPAGTSSQTTDYIYGVAGGANGLFSNDLLATVEYPDPTTGAASTNVSNDVSYTYNALGEQTTMTDQNGTMHQYQYDVLGRLSSDIVTTLGSGVDGAVRRLGYSFDAAGLPFQQTSYSDIAGTTIVNQDQDLYNGLGQLTGEYQSTSGPVVIGSTPEVRYAYGQMAGGANNSRLTSTTYPDGRVVADTYNTGVDDAIRACPKITCSTFGSHFRGLIV